MKKSLFIILIATFALTLIIFPQKSFSNHKLVTTYMSSATNSIVSGITKSGFEYLEANAVKATVNMGAIAGFGASTQLFNTAGRLAETSLRGNTVNNFFKRTQFGEKVTWAQPKSFDDAVELVLSDYNEMFGLMIAEGATQSEIVQVQTMMLRMLGNVSDYFYRFNLGQSEKNKLDPNQVFEIQYFLLKALERITNSENTAQLTENVSINSVWQGLIEAQGIVNSGLRANDNTFLASKLDPGVLEALDKFPYKQEKVRKVFQRMHTNAVLATDAMIENAEGAEFAQFYGAYLAPELLANANTLATRFGLLLPGQTRVTEANWITYVKQLVEQGLSQVPLGYQHQPAAAVNVTYRKF